MTPALAVVLGGGIGIGLLVVLTGLRPKRPGLAQVAASLEHPRNSLVERAQGAPVGDQDLSGWQRPLGRLGVRLIDSVSFMNVGTLHGRLRVLDKTIERHAYEKVFGAVVGFMLPVLAMVVFTAAEVAVSPLLILAAAILLAIGGFFYPDLPLAEKVEKRQQAFRHALSSYLDLVTIILAGGGGIESALEGASEAGEGWPFEELRGALRLARLTRRSPWDVFDELGETLGVGELRELSSTVALAGGQGAKIKTSLIAKADSMRAAQAAQLESAAEVQTEKMIVPVVVLIVGLVLFIGFGAIDAISADGTDFDNTAELGDDP